jgi:hypothetical protein
LSWLGQRRVAVLHEDLPALQPDDLETYLEILSESVRRWKSDEEHELAVSFPERESHKIEVVSKNEIDRARLTVPLPRKAHAYK